MGLGQPPELLWRKVTFVPLPYIKLWQPQWHILVHLFSGHIADKAHIGLRNSGGTIGCGAESATTVTLLLGPIPPPDQPPSLHLVLSSSNLLLPWKVTPLANRDTHCCQCHGAIFSAMRCSTNWSCVSNSAAMLALALKCLLALLWHLAPAVQAHRWNYQHFDRSLIKLLSSCAPLGICFRNCPH